MASANTIIRLLNNDVYLATHITIRLSFLSIYAIIFYPILNKLIGEEIPLSSNLSQTKLKSVTIYTILVVIGDFGKIT